MPDDASLTFAGFPFNVGHPPKGCKAAVIGIPLFCEYPDQTAQSANAPAVIRKESNLYPDDLFAWDFDLGKPLDELCAGKVVDLGDLPVFANKVDQNREVIRSTIKSIINTAAVPVVLGGDDSIPIAVLDSYQDAEPFYVLQLDAHIDWRDEVKGIREGYSSTMRRASEMAWVKGIIQVGARGVGSARREEYQAAMDYGARLIPARDFHHLGVQGMLDLLPKDSRVFLTIDFDVLDPAIMPAVGAPTPGGLFFQETIDLIHAVAIQCSIIGACLVELAPEADINHLGAITAMRMVWNTIGALASKQ